MVVQARPPESELLERLAKRHRWMRSTVRKILERYCAVLEYRCADDLVFMLGSVRTRRQRN
jgi:hypothetical protein